LTNSYWSGYIEGSIEILWWGFFAGFEGSDDQDDYSGESEHTRYQRYGGSGGMYLSVILTGSEDSEYIALLAQTASEGTLSVTSIESEANNSQYGTD
jgi:subtilase family serine protease